MSKYEYYDGRPERGVIYDWKKIRREFDKLKIPKGLYYPCFNAIDQGYKIIQSLSIRSTGKTNAWLLVGMVARRVYPGFTIQYVRTTEEELTPSWASKLFEVIRTFDGGRYIEMITDGEYNDIFYHWRQFFYCWRDPESGEITKKDSSPFVQVLAVSIEESYKSTYNIAYGMGDLVLYDEFITKSYFPDAFFHFFNLFSTIQRGRKSPIIVMLANVQNLYSVWFQEFGISKIVQNMKAGDSQGITTPKGTRLYIEYIKIEEETAKKNRDEVNKLFFGFDNPKLSSITGEADWAFDFFPHIPPENERGENLRVYVDNLYIYANLEYFRVKVCVDDIRGLHARMHRATKIYGDSIILTLEDSLISSDYRYQYGFGYSKKLRNLWSKLIDEKRIYFSTNEVGTIFYDYYKQFKINRK